MEKRKRITILTSEQIQMIIDEWDDKYNVNTNTIR
jgi:hypothetical protein